MSFGISFPYAYSPLFDGLELFTQPRYVRRSYVHPRAPAHCHPQRCGFSRRFGSGRYESDLLDLLTFGNDFFQSWEDDDFVQQIEHERTSPKASPTPKRIEKSETKPSETSVSAAPSSSVIPVTVPKNEVAATPSKRLGEVTTTKTEDATKFEIAFPGLTLADLKLDLDTKKNALIVKADKEIEEKHEDEYGSRKSYKKISFSRYLPLETSPSASDIHADFADGSLHITVARKAVEAAPSVTPLTISSSQASPSVSAPSVTPVPVETTAPEASSSNSPASEATSSSSAPDASSAPSSDSMEAQVTVEDAEEN